MGSVIFIAIDWVLKVLEFAIFARVIISWLPISRENQIIRIIYQVTEPILGPIRGMLERSALGKNMMMDFSPIIAFILIMLVRNILAQLFLRSSFIF